jgi:hypothetical protein
MLSNSTLQCFKELVTILRRAGIVELRLENSIYQYYYRKFQTMQELILSRKLGPRCRERAHHHHGVETAKRGEGAEKKHY